MQDIQQCQIVYVSLVSCRVLMTISSYNQSMLPLTLVIEHSSPALTTATAFPYLLLPSSRYLNPSCCPPPSFLNHRMLFLHPLCWIRTATSCCLCIGCRRLFLHIVSYSFFVARLEAFLSIQSCSPAISFSSCGFKHFKQFAH